MSKILIIDDDRKIRDLLQQYLQSQGMKADVAENAEIASGLIEDNDYALAIVDVMMPGESGVELTKRIKQSQKDIPVLMLTALGSVEDRIKGLESGADDYLPKPFEPKELFLRAKKLIERSGSETSKSVINFGEFEFNLENRILSNNGERIVLSSTESELLYIFCTNLNSEVSRFDLAETFNGISERSIDVQITRLRKKIEQDPKNPVFIQTLRGKGYVFRV